MNPDFVASLFPEAGIKVLAGCAPCQPFSTYTNGICVQQDQWRLVDKFAEIVRSVQPDIVTMENVPRLAKYPVFQRFIDVLDDEEYKHNHWEVKCANYGVPQTRSRLVLLASKLKDIDLIQPTHSGEDFLTVRSVIQDLEQIEAGETSSSDPLHKSSKLSKINLDRIRQSRPGGTWRDWDDSLRADCHVRGSGRFYSSVYGRMRWDTLAPTITTQFNGFGNGRFGHPVQDRAISLREGALLQTFPKDYSFVPEDATVRMTQVARMIGNAVPVNLGNAIGQSIMVHLEGVK